MSFIDLVREELEKARRQHAPQHSAHEAYAVILEEVDEFWEEVRAKRDARSPEKMLKELVQVGAMAQRAAEDLGLVPEEISRGATSSVMREAMRELHPGSDF